MCLILHISGRKQPLLIRLAAQALNDGAITIFPTETCYGLGCDATDETAIRRIFEIKKRNRKKALPIIVSNLQIAKEYCYITGDAEKLTKKFMPGPLTLVVKAKRNLPKALTANSGKIAFRISGSKIANALAKELGKPIVATSANLEGKPEIYSGKEAIEKFAQCVDVIIDAGALPKRKPSAIYDIPGKKILRAGKISEKQIKKALKSASNKY